VALICSTFGDMGQRVDLEARDRERRNWTDRNTLLSFLVVVHCAVAVRQFRDRRPIAKSFFATVFMNRTSTLVVPFLVTVFVSAAILNADPEPPTAPKKDLSLPGETFRVKNSPAFVMLPAENLRRKPQPWIWYAPTLPGLPDSHEKWMHEQFIDAGIAVAGIDVGESYGGPRGNALFNDFYREMTERRGFAAKPVLLGRSRGGLMICSWAIEHPESVAGIAGIYPVFDLRTYPGLDKAAPAYGMTANEFREKSAQNNPIERLAPLAKARVPTFLIHGDADTVVPLRENSAEFVRRYEAAGVSQSVKLVVAADQGHNYWEGFFHSQELVDFAIEHARPGDLKSPLTRLEVNDGDSIVFFGDSITHQCLYTQYVEDYFYTRFPKMRLRMHNAGVSGDVAWEALERFDGDVAAYKPKYVMVLLGMNDGNHEPFNQAIFDTYRHDMTAIFRRIEKINATPIILTPTMFDARIRRIRRPAADTESTSLYNAVLAYYGAWLRERAVEQGFGFVDLWGPLNDATLEQRKTDPNFTLVPDSVHPGPAGHVVMAAAIVHDLGLPRQVSNLRITLDAKGQHQVEAAGGQLRDLRWHDNRLEFTWHAECLPWVLPEEAQTGVRLTDLGHRLSRESLEIHGLAPGKYALIIDGHDVGAFDSEQLELHVELQDNARTPQYHQALEIARLNERRNEGAVDALRDEWWKFQEYIDARREARAHPDSVQAADKLSEAKRQIGGMARRVAEDEVEAKRIEDKIYELNRPPARKYALVRKAP
jgi:lysophospholipase L1-like esterase/pimeloyl-ACP methyl ester carboxylesterase